MTLTCYKGGLNLIRENDNISLNHFNLYQEYISLVAKEFL